MNKKTMIISTVIITTLVIFAGIWLYNYQVEQYNDSYNDGYNNGLLYTQESGNIVFSDNGTLGEVPVVEICNRLIQQELNSLGGQ